LHSHSSTYLTSNVLIYIQEHEATHAGIRNICHICGMGLVTSCHLKRHLKNKHPEGSVSFPMTGRGPSKQKPHKWKKLPATITSEANVVAESKSSSDNSAAETADVVMMDINPLQENPIGSIQERQCEFVPISTEEALISMEVVADPEITSPQKDPLAIGEHFLYPYLGYNS